LGILQTDSKYPLSTHPADPHPMTWNPIPKNAIASIMGVAMGLLWAMPGRMRRLVVGVVLRRGVSLSGSVPGLCDVH